MGLERKSGDHFRCSGHNSSEDDVLVQRKAFEIPKSLVWMAYRDVRRNRGRPPIGETYRLNMSSFRAVKRGGTWELQLKR